MIITCVFLVDRGNDNWLINYENMPEVDESVKTEDGVSISCQNCYDCRHVDVGLNPLLLSNMNIWIQLKQRILLSRQNGLKWKKPYVQTNNVYILFLD